MINANVDATHGFWVQAGTRNHKGFFVPEALYQLINIEASGWAWICQDNSTCHFIDPDNLQLL